MKVYNKTNQIQTISVYDRNTRKPYEIYVCSNSTTEIFNDMVVKGDIDRDKFLLLSDEGIPIEETPRVFKELTQVEDICEDAEVVDIDETLIDTVSEESNIEEEVEEDSSKAESSSFICEICGAEFASSRGLSTHMKKSHSN